MAALQNLLKQRKQIIDKQNRFITYFDQNRNDEHLTQIKLRFKKFIPLYDEFQDIQKQIELLDIKGDHSHESQMFEDNYFAIQAEVQTFVEKHESTVEVDANLNNSQKIANSNQIVKLPKMGLPEFHDNYETWLPFKNSFEALVHSKPISNIEKFLYLKSCLKNKAAEVIQSMEITDSNYENAWQLICARYENKRLIIHSHVSSLFNIQQINDESYIKIRHLVDDVNKSLRSLQSLNLPVNSWDVLLIHLITTKLDNNTKREWELWDKSSELPSVYELLSFLTRKCQVLETLGTKHTLKTNKRDQYHTHVSVSQNTKCSFCSASHPIYKCASFLKLPVTTRITEVKKRNLCNNCLKNQYDIQSCKSGTCRKCNNKHNTLLHTEEITSVVASNSCSDQIVLSTAQVDILSKNKTVTARALLDSGSMANYITENLCHKLRLQTYSVQTSVKGINKSHFSVNKAVQVTLKSKYNSYTVTLTFYVLPNITNYLPITDIDISELHIPPDIKLAPTFYQSNPIDLLIGASIFYKLLCIGQIKTGPYLPTFQKTKFGWVVSGHMGKPSNQTPTFCHFSLNEQLEKFWKIEEILEHSQNLSYDEKRCEQLFSETTTRDINGRFVLKLPFKENMPQLGKSYELALKRLESTQRRLNTDNTLKEQYHNFLKEYENLGHMTKIGIVNSDNISNFNFLPHHAVVKTTSLTTKCRVVFDGSAKTTNGVSLNDTLHIGPKLQQDLFEILIRFRFDLYVLAADIVKMYRQILIHSDHRNLQSILWRDSDSNVCIYVLNTVTYGLASSPYQAIRCLHELAKIHSETHPVESNIIYQDFFVDDLLTGSDQISELIEIRDNLIKILNSAGFTLNKWMSNSSDVVSNLSNVSSSDVLIIEGDQITKTLGIQWNVQMDTLHYKVCVPLVTNMPNTKRSILSHISKLFDPLGLLSPTIIIAKIMLQELWKNKSNWDDPISSELQYKWETYIDDLQSFNNFQIQRCTVLPTKVFVQLIGFCDSSQVAYGACMYVRCLTSDGQILVTLLCAKSRVAPLHTTTLARLELNAALILAKLSHKVIKSISG